MMSRDSAGCAIKATYGEAIVDGVTQCFELFKDPITDDGTKRSAKGLLRVEKTADGNWILHENQTWEQEAQGELKPKFKDGLVLPDGDIKFSQIREELWPTLALEASDLYKIIEDSVAANDYGYVQTATTIAVA